MTTLFAQRYRERSQARLAEGRALWRGIHEALTALGVESELFGSMARGDAHPTSDLDILISNDSHVRFGDLMRAIDAVAGEFPVDIVFAAAADPDTLARMRKEAMPQIEREPDHA